MSDTAYNQGPAMMAARGQTYGKRQEQMQAQQAVPMRRAQGDTSAAQAAKEFARPMPSGSLFAPTARPTEPITAGAPFGPGPGPAAAGIPMITPEQQAVQQLRQIAVVYQLDDLLDAVDAYGDEL
jgi:hypothetical protein